MQSLSLSLSVSQSHSLSISVYQSLCFKVSQSQFLRTKFGHAVSVSQFIILLVLVSVSMYKTKLQWVLFITVMFARSELP